MSSVFSVALSRIKGCADPLAGLPDDELLNRFLDDSDERAFEVLVQRHGPLVRSVCTRILGNGPDVDDAFQACFLVLVRKARGIRNPSSLGPWLYGVALRVSKKTAKQAARRKRLETAEAPPVAAPSARDITLSELSGILDQEIGSLPEKYRAPLILCCLQGKSRDEAARELGWSFGAVKGRLERARDMLRDNLARRGVQLSIALFALLVPTTHATAAIPSTVLNSTMQAVQALSVGSLASPALNIARVVLAEMAVERVRSWGLGVVLFLAGVCTMAAPWGTSPGRQLPAHVTSVPAAPPAPLEVAAQDRALPDVTPPEEAETEPIEPPAARPQTGPEPPLMRTPSRKNFIPRAVSFVHTVHQTMQRSNAGSTILSVLERHGNRYHKKSGRDHR